MVRKMVRITVLSLLVTEVLRDFYACENEAILVLALYIVVRLLLIIIIILVLNTLELFC